MYRWVLGSTSGLTRSAIGATLPIAAATRAMASSSASLSTLNIKTPASSPAWISSSVLPTPANTVLPGSPPASPHPVQLARRDDVEPAAVLGHHLEDAQVRVGLHRVADQRVDLGERRLERLERPQDRRLAVDVQRRAEPLGQLGRRDVLAVQLPVAVVEGFHGSSDCRCRELVSGSQGRHEFVDRQIGTTDQAPERSLGDFLMIGNRQGHLRSG